MLGFRAEGATLPMISLVHSPLFRTVCYSHHIKKYNLNKKQKKGQQE